MSNARLGYRHCTYCRKPEAEVGKLSVRGNCRECGIEAAVSNVIQQQTKSGPFHRRAVKRKAEAAERELSRLDSPVAA